MKALLTSILLAFLATLVVTSCGTTKSSKSSFAPAEPAPRRALVYIYRPSAFRNFVGKAGVLIGDNRLLTLSNGSYGTVQLPAGPQVFTVNPGVGEEAVSRLVLKSGETYFLKVSASENLTNLLNKFKFTVQSREKGLKELAPLKLSPTPIEDV